MWRSGARRSCETEYENASSSLLARPSSSASSAICSARSSAMPSSAVRNSSASSISPLCHGALVPWTVSRQVAKLVRGVSCARGSLRAVLVARIAGPVDGVHDFGTEPQQVVLVDARNRHRQQAAGVAREGGGRRIQRRPGGRCGTGRRGCSGSSQLDQRARSASVAGASPKLMTRSSTTMATPPARANCSSSGNTLLMLSMKSALWVRPASIDTMMRRTSRRNCRSSASSRDSMHSDRIWPSCSQALRLSNSSGQGAALWHEIRPHSWPLTISEIDIEASVSMLRMYCRWIGDTLRSAANDRSLGAPVSGLICRHQPRRRVVGVLDQADAVDHVQFARLARNVGGGKALAEVGRVIVGAAFGQHVAVAVAVELVHHHAAETGERADLARRQRAHRLDGGGAGQLLQEFAHQRKQVAEVGRRAGVRWPRIRASAGRRRRGRARRT